MNRVKQEPFDGDVCPCTLLTMGAYGLASNIKQEPGCDVSSDNAESVSPANADNSTSFIESEPEEMQSSAATCASQGNHLQAEEALLSVHEQPQAKMHCHLAGRKRCNPFVIEKASIADREANEEDEGKEPEGKQEELESESGDEDEDGGNREGEQLANRVVSPGTDDETEETEDQSTDVIISSQQAELQEDTRAPSLYQRLDNDIEKAAERGEELAVPSYFPKGLAVEVDQPLVFNFDLFLYDSLHLPLGLFEDDGKGPVHFTSLQSCQAYCRRFATEQLRKVNEGPEESTPTQATIVDNKQMFNSAGTSLQQLLTAGIACCDKQLARVRRDRFGNIMVFGAPPWSDVCPYFMHGFPRRLISADHGGFLPGNICIAAKVSNQAMQSLAPGGIAAFCSRQVIENLGLTLSELFLARHSALPYAGQRRQPRRLVQTMLRYGIDFLTFSPLDASSLESLLQLAVALNQSHVDYTPPAQSEDLDSSETETNSDDFVELDSAVIYKQLSQEERQLVQTESPRLQVLLLHNFVSKGSPAEDDRSRQVLEREAHTRAIDTLSKHASARSSGGGRKRTENTVRQLAGQHSAGQSSTNTAADAGMTQQAAGAEEYLRERLSGIPGVVMNHVPKSSSLGNLRDFLTKHTPLPHAEIAEVARPICELLDAAGSTTLFQVVALDVHKAQRSEEVRLALQGIWRLVSRSCTCLPPGNLSGQHPSTPPEHCPYKASEAEGNPIDPASAICRAENCSVCGFFRHFDRVSGDVVLASLNKNTRLQNMVALAPLLVEFVWFRTINSAEEHRLLKALLADLLCCGHDKLNSILSVGYLARVTPRIGHLYLSSGWSGFWKYMRTISNAIYHQNSQVARLAVLIYIRSICSPPNSPWRYYLTSSDEAGEAAALKALLAN